MAPEPKGTGETAPPRDAPSETAERILRGLLKAKDDLDREEQSARIAKLRAETRTEDERQELVVRFVDFPEEAAE